MRAAARVIVCIAVAALACACVPIGVKATSLPYASPTSGAAPPR